MYLIAGSPCTCGLKVLHYFSFESEFGEIKCFLNILCVSYGVNLTKIIKLILRQTRHTEYYISDLSRKDLDVYCISPNVKCKKHVYTCELRLNY